MFELNKPWHFRHFCCYICDANLTEHSSYVPRDGKQVDCQRRCSRWRPSPSPHRAAPTAQT